MVLSERQCMSGPYSDPSKPVLFPVVDELPAGLYEVLLSEGLKERLGTLADARPTEQRALRAAETPDRVAWHLSREIERALSDVPDKDRARVGIDVARALITSWRDGRGRVRHGPGRSGNRA
jgi:hypothetical protein